MSLSDQLVSLADTFVGASGRSEGTVANMARRDAGFFQRLRDGRTCSLDTFGYLVQWFSNNWPDDTAWPDSIARPAVGTPLPELKSRKPRNDAPPPQAA